MAIAIRGTTPANTGNVATDPISVSLTGARQPQAGDKLLIFHSNDFYASSAMVTPTVNGSATGVTAITNGSMDPGTDFTHVKSYFYDVLSTGDITVQEDETGAADEEKGLTVYVLSGAATGQPASAASSNSTLGQASHVVTGVTASAADDWLFIHIATNGSATWTPPGGSYVEDIDTGGTGGHTTGHEPLSASGATGTRTFTPSGSVAWSAVAVAVQAGGAAAPAESPRISFRPGKTWRRRFKHLQRLALDPTVTAVAPDADPTQAGYGLTWRWGRYSYTPQQRQLASPPGLLDTAELENELLGGATTQLRTNVPASHVDRREVPQQRILESSYGLLDQAQLEVLPPLPWWYDEAAYLRTPWLRIKQQQSDQSAAAGAPDFDLTQGGYGPEWRRWRRDAIALQQRQLESPPGLLDTAELENELLGGATTELRTFLPATHVDRREVPQYTLRTSSYGLLDLAQLEVPPPLPWWYGEAAFLRTPWLRFKQQQSDQSSAATTPFDPTQAGYSLRHVWRRDLYAPTQRPGIQNPDDVVIVGTGATGGWWGVDDTAHHFNHWLPTASDPSFYTPLVLADPTQAGYGPRWMWYRPPVAPVQRELESNPNLLLTALLEVVPPLSIAYGLAATHQRLPWLRIKQQQYDQSAAAIITDFDPTQSGGYGPEWRWWYRPPVAPVQRERESDPGLLNSALLEEALLGGWDDLVRHRSWFARPWLGLQRIAIIDQSSQPAPDADPTQAGYGPRWMWHRPPVAPVQRERESDPRLLLTALLEDALLGGWDDILRHRTWYVDRREVPQQRSYPDALTPLADPLLVGGAEWRYKLIPVTHRARWVLRQWWQQQMFQGSPLLLFEGTIVGGIRGGSGMAGGTRGGAGVAGTSGSGGYLTGGVA